ncbi:hypothetical protein RHMOL_Rhmol11G0174800 [Rhododendron molle]|uniref:Uncharacterized protein n=1 Tax=Rhododendron molle TaxID=49168 RepID=A0ACC0LT98_RHOML|nr:hypothetical protein RHMOL_Rhmol11G0174800 [Rhododendron molle]
MSQLVATGTCVHVEGELKVPPVEAKQRVELIGVQMILDLGTVDPAKYPLPHTRLTLESLRDYVHLRPRTNTKTNRARKEHCVGGKEAMDNASDPSELLEILDPAMGWGTSLVCLEKFLDLAMSCVGEINRSRPKMGEVVREIENIIQEAGSNLNSKFVVFNLSSFEEKTDGFDSSVSFVPFRVEGH